MFHQKSYPPFVKSVIALAIASVLCVSGANAAEYTSKIEFKDKSVNGNGAAVVNSGTFKIAYEATSEEDFSVFSNNIV